MPIQHRPNPPAQPVLQGRHTGANASNLPLVHVTTVGAAREILRTGQIERRLCPVFNEELVYFFALRPAYKPKDSERKRRSIDYFPFVFVVETTDLPTPFHVYPFDTGGAHFGAFDAGASDWVYLEDYELDETIDAVANHIDWAFGTRAAYFDCHLKANLTKLPDWDSGALTYAAIAGLAQSRLGRPDQRASSIELAFDLHISTTDHIVHAVLPRQFLQTPAGHNLEMIKALNAANIKYDVYDWRSSKAPEYYRPELTSIVRAYLAKRGSI